MAASRTVPCSSLTSCGSSRIVAPARRACSMHRSTSGTSRARSITPSPWRRWWSAWTLSEATAPMITNRAEPDAQHERLVVAVAGLGAAVADELHAHRGLVEACALRGVAADEHDRVHRGDRERVGGGVVVDQADELLEPLGGQVGVTLLRRQGDGRDNRRGGHVLTLRLRCRTGKCDTFDAATCTVCPAVSGHSLDNPARARRHVG